MKTILDYNSAWMSARVDFEKWRVKFEAGFGEPIARAQLAVLMASMPPGVHAALDQMIPDEHRAVMEMIGGK